MLATARDFYSLMLSLQNGPTLPEPARQRFLARYIRSVDGGPRRIRAIGGNGIFNADYIRWTDEDADHDDERRQVPGRRDHPEVLRSRPRSEVRVDHMRTSLVRIVAATSMLVLSAGATWTSCAAPSGTTPSAVVNGEAGTRLDQFITKLVPAGFSGTVLVARKGDILVHKGYGFADRFHNIPASTDTVYDIGSITKQFTAAAIMKLEMDGKLSTEDKLPKFFKDVPAAKAGITVHHLLTHTAGFDHGYGNDDVVATRDSALRLFLSKPLLSKPGEKYRYSNAGYGLLTAIVENVSGQPYERYLHEQFFRPARIRKTGYRIPKWNPSEISRNYDRGKDNGPPLDRVWGPEGPYWHLFGNGGILSTPGDMYKWELALQSNAVLSSAAWAKMLEPYVPMESDGDTRYGYGWYTGKTASGATFSGHTGGSSFGVSAGHFRFPGDGLVVIYHCNRIPVPGNEKRGLLGRLSDLAIGRATIS